MSVNLNTNLVVQAGRVAVAGEMRQAGSSQVLTFKLANNRNYKKTGSDEWTKEPMFIRVEVWGDAATRLDGKLAKGTPVSVQGSLKYEEWEKDGVKGREHKIRADKVDIIERQGGESQNEEEQEEAPAPRQAPKGGAKKPASKAQVSDDDLPF